MVIFEGHDEFLGLIPRTILIKHYVSLQILLKQLVVHVFSTSLCIQHCCVLLVAVLFLCALIFTFFSSLTAEVQKDLPNNKQEQERRWLEQVPSFSGKIYEAQPHADYGFTHSYNSDTESINVETCSSVTQFDLLYEDDQDTEEIYEAQPHADYEFTHSYDSDTESINFETCSSVTEFDLLHEDDQDEFFTLQPSDLQSLTGELWED